MSYKLPMKTETIQTKLEKKYGTIKKVAEKLAITEATWHNWKSGKVPVKETIRLAMERLLDE